MAPTDASPVPEERFERIVDPVDGTTWQVDMGFLGSTWQCIWGRGCQGILPTPAEDLQQGCCSRGCEVLEEEAMNIAALAATLDDGLFQHHREAFAGGVFADGAHRHTRLVDDACIFLNRPGFRGGAGCALHLGALDAGESPTTWKPAICWQLPIKVDEGELGTKVVRRWKRSDWDGEGAGGSSDRVAWCCTEEPDPYAGGVPVTVSMREELDAVLGPEVATEVASRITEQGQ